MDKQITCCEKERQLDTPAEKSRQFIQNAIELALSLGDFQKEIDSQCTPDTILAEVARRIGQLIAFESSALYLMDEDTSDIRLSICQPEESKAFIGDQIEFLIDNGFLAWGIRERRGVTIFSKDGSRQILLHVMATYSRIIGMFVGIFPAQTKRLPDAALEILSIILRNSANCLESIAFFSMMEDRQSALQKLVDDKAQKLVRYESQLMLAQKTDAVAALAGGIAHQFNNALTGLVGNLDLAEMTMDKDSKIAEYIHRTRPIVERMTHLTRQLLAYAQGGKFQPCLTSFNKLLEDAMPVIRRAIAPSIRIETKLCEQIAMVKVDVTQMQMVLTAIVTNAVEAMLSDGTIRVSSENFFDDRETETHSMGHEPGTCVRLRIEDKGQGMDEDTKRRMFEPFFSTKFHGRGLSMAAVLGIVKNHHGWIDVETEVGKGTIVQISLPAVRISTNANG
jgi:signal transduction histidine kinase